MAITRISNPNIVQYSTAGTATFTITDNEQFIKVVETSGVTINFDKSTFSISFITGGMMLISDSTQQLEFVFSQAGYASQAAAVTALEAMKQNMPPAAPSSSSSTAWTYVTTPTNAASGIIKASAGVFRGLIGYNAKTTNQFFMVFAGSATVPADGTAPTICIPIAAQSSFFIDIADEGIYDATGWTWSNSSTQETKTIDSADCFVTSIRR